jgi:hypothetical protein
MRGTPNHAGAMTDADYAAKLEEIDRLLNDPETPMQPALVWSLLAEVASHHTEQVSG